MKTKDTILKVLTVHNFYRSSAPSGENVVYRAEKKLLKDRGLDVAQVEYISDTLQEQGIPGLIKGVLLIPWNPLAAGRLRSVVAQGNYDVVHVHNTFPLISPAIFHAIGRRAARVLTLHNFRLFCSAAVLMRNGKICSECLDKRSATPAVMHGCYRGSRIATIPLAISVALHRAIGTWTDQVDAFICLTDFQRDIMIRAGLPPEKVYVKPNFVPGKPRVVDWKERRPCVVFAGRLTEEKGVVTLIQAWRAWGENAPELRLVGDGHLRPKLEQMAAGLPIRFLGQLSPDQAKSELAHAYLQILPSELYETFGLVVIEAFACGTPAAVSNIGPLPSIVTLRKNGVVFQAGDPHSLLKEVRTAWDAPGLLMNLGHGARAEFESKYTETVNFNILMNIYRHAIEIARYERRIR